MNWFFLLLSGIRTRFFYSVALYKKELKQLLFPSRKSVLNFGISFAESTIQNKLKN